MFLVLSLKPSYSLGVNFDSLDYLKSLCYRIGLEVFWKWVIGYISEQVVYLHCYEFKRLLCPCDSNILLIEKVN